MLGRRRPFTPKLFLLIWASAPAALAQTIQLEDTKLVASDGEPGDLFGYTVAVNGDMVVIGAFGADPMGAAYVFARQGARWVEQDALMADSVGPGDNFGTSVAFDRETVVVGSPGDDDRGDLAGAAYVFVRDGSDWVQQAKLLPNGGFETFGTSVAVDGDTIVVGAPLASPGGLIAAGQVYVFERNRGTEQVSPWTLQAVLVPGNPTPLLEFGDAVVLSGDTIGVRAPSPKFGFHATYLFDRVGREWIEYDQSFPAGYPQLSGDTFALGNQIYVRNGAVWELQAAPVPSSGFTGIVALEGDVCVFSACVTSGAAVFTRSGSIWTEQAVLTASDGLPNDLLACLGASISGNTVVLGAWHQDALGSNSGAAYVYTIDVPECFLVIGNAPGDSSFVGASHLFETQVGPAVEASYAVLMESIPEFELPPLVGAGPSLTGQGAARLGGPRTQLAPPEPATPAWLLDGQVTVQVLLWNPMVFPGQPEQYSTALMVDVRPDGTVTSLPLGQGQGDLTVWAEVTENEQGQRVLRFPFLVGGL